MDKSKILRLKVKEMLNTIAELEKKERQVKIKKAGQLCDSYFNNDFTNFSADSFIKKVKEIFAGDEVEPVTESKPKTVVEPQPAPAPAPAPEVKKGWF